MFLLIIIVLCILLYYYGTRTFNYWSDRNVPHNKPIPFFGNNYDVYMQKKSRSQVATALYRQYPNEKIVGFYRGLTPVLLIRDPDIIKHIMNVDFQHFHVRGVGRNPEVEPMMLSLFHVDGDTWKLLRQRLTPAFTSGKLKAMFPLIVECAEELQQLTHQICKAGEPYDVRELMARFTTDFIGACGFGIKMNSINDSNSQFRQLGKNVFKFDFVFAVKAMLKEIAPKLFDHLKPMDQSIEDSVVSILRTILEQRNHAPSGRNDFVDLMLELKQQGKLVTESLEKFNEDGTPVLVEQEMTLILMAAQCFVFFLAGFETSSSATSFTLNQLAYNPEVQKKAYEEVDRVLAKYNNKLSYEAVKEMSYLEATLKEGLRMFPSLGVLNRTCTRKYQLPGTQTWIDAGVRVVIPVDALQNDEKYFPNPDEFSPARFLNGQEKHKYIYMPFGEGPRGCIGPRLGLMQSVSGLAALLQRFTVHPAPASAGGCRHVKISPRANISQIIEGGIPLLFKRRQNLS